MSKSIFLLALLTFVSTTAHGEDVTLSEVVVEKTIGPQGPPENPYFSASATCSGSARGQRLTASVQNRSLDQQMALNRAEVDCRAELTRMASALSETVVTREGTAEIAAFPEAELRQCVAAFLNAKTRDILSEKIYGADADPTLRNDQTRWADLCSSQVGESLKRDLTEKLAMVESARTQWRGTVLDEMRDCLQSHRDRRLEALISPIAPTTATCEQQIKAKVVAGLRPVLADPNLLNSTGEHICRSVVAAQVAADPLTSPDRLACQGQAGTSQDVTAANGDECRSKLDEALKTLLKDDTKNILGLQYELTTLKLARLAKKDSVKTLEGLVKKKQDGLLQLDDGTRTKMREAYRKYGKIEDVATIDRKISELSTKARNANYQRGAQRFYGEDTSSFLLALQASDPDSRIDESDVAISWVMKQVQDRMVETQGRFSAGHNLMNLSTQVAALAGYIDPSKEVSSDAIDARVSQTTNELNSILEGFSNTFKENHPQCFNAGIFAGTGHCWTMNDTVVPALANALSEVAQEIRTAERTNVELRRGLGAKIGDYKVFFNRLAMLP